MSASTPRPTGFSKGDYPETTREAVDSALRTKGVDPAEIEIAMIWAQTTDGIIGDGKDMPWYLPEDLQHFKDATVGYPVIMGRTSCWSRLSARFRDGRTSSSRATRILMRPVAGWLVLFPTPLRRQPPIFSRCGR